MSHTDDEERRIARETEREFEVMAYNEFLIEMAGSDNALVASTAADYLDSEEHLGPDAEQSLTHEAAGYRIGLVDQKTFEQEHCMNRLETVRDAVARIPGVLVADLLIDDDGDVVLQVFTKRPRLFMVFAAPLIRAASQKKDSPGE